MHSLRVFRAARWEMCLFRRSYSSEIPTQNTQTPVDLAKEYASFKQEPQVAWLQHYYKKPRPDLLIPSMEIIIDTKENIAAQPALAIRSFMCGLLHKATPEQAQDWFIALMTLETGNYNLVDFAIRSFHMADRPAADRLLETAMKAMSTEPEVIAKFSEVLSLPRTPLLRWPVPGVDHLFNTEWRKTENCFSQSQWLIKHRAEINNNTSFRDSDKDYFMGLLASPIIIDCMWGYFFATGENLYINRIIEIAGLCHRYVESSDDLVNFDLDSLQASQPSENNTIRNTGMYASWSLLANSVHHVRVRELLEQHANSELSLPPVVEVTSALLSLIPPKNITAFRVPAPSEENKQLKVESADAQKKK